MQTLPITANDAGMRIDKFLAQALGLSRREVLLVLEHKCVYLNNHTLTQKAKGQLITATDSLSIADYSNIISTEIIANPNIKLEILSEGNGYVVVDKPAGLPVMPLKAHETDTVLNAVIAHHPELQDVGQTGGEGGLRSGVVHRLDTDTSGALVIATEEQRWQNLREAFTAHQTTKKYRAIVHGTVPDSGTVRMNLVIAQHKPAKVRVVTRPEQSNSSERECDLSWRTLETFHSASLIEVQLGTGFMHQIRVMFAHMGHPVIGDKVYSNPTVAFKADRQMLHASSIEVLDIEAHSPDPEDFTRLLEVLGR